MLHTPGHTEGSVCLLAEDDGLLFSGDTLFQGGWGRVDLPGGDPAAMVASLARLTGLEDHIGDNAAVATATGADIAVHPLDRVRLTDPQPIWAPFEIPPSVPAVELAEGGEIRFGEIRLRVLHTPGHTEGSVCLLAADDGLLFSGDTLFAGGWGRIDLPGGSAEAMAASIARLTELEDPLIVLPGHGATTTIGRERAWMDLVRSGGRLFA